MCEKIKGITGEYQRHDYLTPEEFKLMYDTPTPYMNKTQTRRFFIFSCLTGLPHRECIELKWKDIYSENDKLGKLSLSLEGCKERDRFVLDLCKQNKIPVQISMGGGYSFELKNIIEAHSNTFRLAQEIFF